MTGWLRMEVTAYCIRGRTASGAWTRAGTIAAARSVPFGTKFFIPGYGYGVVQDRGGAITEGKLDIWLPTYQAAMNWGRRRIWVRRLT